jgi:NAD(P)-dependent dehydrogenase (short-subunit alcohol dehydrogenase family)
MCAELKALSQLGNGGSIVNAASIAGIKGLRKNEAYIASKHAVVGLTKAAANEYGAKNIRINAIAP